MFLDDLQIGDRVAANPPILFPPSNPVFVVGVADASSFRELTKAVNFMAAFGHSSTKMGNQLVRRLHLTPPPASGVFGYGSYSSLRDQLFHHIDPLTDPG
ncbi:hypothetical protein, partial [Rhizobium sp. RU36D]|uniref:hypothetical protein n=1 Tax=Rhizobium sp. RU36D TaxID=1907415 RepID=UPI001AECDC2E